MECLFLVEAGLYGDLHEVTVFDFGFFFFQVDVFFLEVRARAPFKSDMGLK